MLKNKKINAFTISEMLVVLVISGIIISIAMVVLNLVQGQIKSVQSVYKKNTEIQLLERALWQDFNTYNLHFNASGSLLKGVSEIDSIKYLFKENYVLRNTDTLKTPVYQLKTFLDGEEVTSGKIDALELLLSKEIKTKRIFIFKKNDAAHYLNDHGL